MLDHALNASHFFRNGSLRQVRSLPDWLTKARPDRRGHRQAGRLVKDLSREKALVDELLEILELTFDLRPGDVGSQTALDGAPVVLEGLGAR